MNRPREAKKTRYKYELETDGSRLLSILLCNSGRDRRGSEPFHGDPGRSRRDPELFHGSVDILLPQFRDTVNLQGRSIGHLLLSSHFMDEVSRKEEHHDMFWKALSCLPNITRLSIEGSRQKKMEPLRPVQDLIDLLLHFQPTLEELHLTRVYIRSTCADQCDRLGKSVSYLTRLRVFRSIDTPIRLFSKSRKDNVIWDTVATLPEIETFHLEYSQHRKLRIDPTLPDTARSLSTSKNLKHVFLKGPFWSNLGSIARVLIGPVQWQKRHRNGDRKVPFERKSSFVFESLHLEGPSINKEGLIAVVETKSCRVKRLSLVNYGGCDFVDDTIIRSLAKVLQHNVTLKHLHIHPLRRVTSAGYGALLGALMAPHEKNAPFNGTLGHFPLENVKNKLLLKHLRQLLALNKNHLRRYARVPSPDTKILHADLSGLLNSYPRGSPADELDLLEILFGLFSGNVGLLCGRTAPEGQR